MNLPTNPNESLRRRNPHLYGRAIINPLPYPVPKPYEEDALGATVHGEEKSDGRISVRFVGYRIRPLDPDNFAASVKDLLDGIRHSGLISGDDPTRIRLETEQVKVKHKFLERTEIEIHFPDK